MKLLAVDVGNTELKQAVIENGVVGQVKRSSTADIADVIPGLLAQELPIALCSVRTFASQAIKDALQQQNKKLLLEISHDVSEPVSGFYAGMGADRIADVCAAWSHFNGDRAVAVIGLGSATTITAASASGRFKGGFITLGLGAVSETMSKALPELPVVNPKQARLLEPAFDVYSSVCRGAVAAHVGIIEEWIRIFRREVDENISVIATGGWSDALSPFCKSFDLVDPLLTFRGIWTILQCS